MLPNLKHNFKALIFGLTVEQEHLSTPKSLASESFHVFKAFSCSLSHLHRSYQFLLTLTRIFFCIFENLSSSTTNVKITFLETSPKVMFSYCSDRPICPQASIVMCYILFTASNLRLVKWHFSYKYNINREENELI